MSANTPNSVVYLFLSVSVQGAELKKNFDGSLIYPLLLLWFVLSVFKVRIFYPAQFHSSCYVRRATPTLDFVFGAPAKFTY